MEDNRTVKNLIKKNCFMCKIDLRDAYFLISVHRKYRRYLRFKFNGVIYEFNCLPFGLNIAPYVFTKLMKPIFSFLRARGFLSVVFLDDILLIGNTYAECLTNRNETLDLLLKLGFVPNYEKSILIPSQVIQYIGFIYSSIDMSVSLPQDKVSSTLELVSKFLLLEKCSIRDFARMLGKVTSICPGIKYGWLYTKYFERQKFLALQSSNENYNATMKILPLLYEDFQWWIKNLPKAKNFIQIDSFAIEIFSDASSTGWGISCLGKKSRGFWSVVEKEYHINYLELLAVFFGLKCFASHLSNCNILCRVDNTTALAYINKMGSVQYPKLNNLSRTIWQWCEERNLFLYASYIKSIDNWEADHESRSLATETEWALDLPAFMKISSSFGEPEIDLFASRTNAKCGKFVSWLRDPESIAIDAFTLNWNQLKFYAFPPFALILRVLNKIISDNARGILVVPLWTAQPWYPVFLSLLEREPIIFAPYKNLMSFNSTPHPLWRKTTLAAGIVSAKH
ncbi:uncharacterized protein LOC126743396 isoform X1 [Anthonomus grandis grandis]|uniref:uncharacterized protein LOC126734842 isoform X1 n=1 Tax=Anthonomus grandis grandis TaxID=2921223 RepID=UPI002165AAE8|nr:uncharacterized protein LOC126734842 isoform X1 [Anthonomus grandis grandis]XP_050294578.1 uncharacterized protein LOC126734843 isoform X1 [Anthonomus grandis grandis]XP_050306421.1 uncharacterized protein LOC126743392 isoform X1 [Anthonomus grandis grandis]XP_050306423.1 uncharacterized protein LOC126743393 isoform X1 [Anthonomus grandis grandis]XP_050306425.1 uncharacterized protein LOC126743395 isoform X1 [Anthonomus grandis grandis]XP_050306427.1 uncharacterized protein LOC126743396 iso